MEAAGAAASIIAIIELAAKTTSLCLEYSRAVKNAGKDIFRLYTEIKGLERVMKQAEQLYDHSNGAKLSTSHEALQSLDGCRAQFETLHKKLKPAKKTKWMTKLKLRELTWPFESKEVDKVIEELERYQRIMSLALQVDQTKLVQDIETKLDLEKLPFVEGAAFNSYSDQLDARCHQDTRVKLRQQIREWVRDPQNKPIFWLNGMAGTGKSTISRTVAQEFADQCQLGASFFFKRGEGDRGNASRFFTTITTQLAHHLPVLIPHIKAVVEAEPTISSKTMKEQFEKLVQQPLMQIKVQPHIPLVVVIDALDECENDSHIKLILHLLAQTRLVRTVNIRILVTSRPELPIRLGFQEMSGDTHQDLVLHKVPQSIIEHDIAAFLKDELAQIQEQNNRSLTTTWPGEQNIQILVAMAVPLFIFAATVCRFIGDFRFDPEEQLDIILKYQSASQTDQLDRTYRPVLDRLITNTTEFQEKQVLGEFRDVVGPIIVLSDPLSANALANLLNIPRKIIDRRLDALHSVLDISADPNSPIRLLHLSFRDFLLDVTKREKNQFWIDKEKMHKRIAFQCLDLLSKTDRLKQDICNVGKVGKLRSDINNHTILQCLPTEVQYACRYWAYHLKQGNCHVSDQDQVHRFLEQRFIYWLEALSLIGRISDVISMIAILQSLIKPDNSSILNEFLGDARRFISMNRNIVDNAPLQLYVSAIIFAPETSVIRTKFRRDIPNWIGRLPKVQKSWDATLQTLEGHSNWVSSVAFSPDGKQLASGSYDHTIKLWDAASGALQQTLEGHSNGVSSVAFSPDGKQLASGSYDNTIKMWDAASGALQQTLEGHSNWVISVAFSPDGKQLASGSYDHTIKLWDAAPGALQQTLEGHSNGVSSVAFSPDGKQLASGSYDCTIKLWDAASGALQQTLEGHSDSVSSVAFSPDGKQLASGSYDNTIKMWDAASGALQQTLEGHSNWVRSVAFSPDGKQLASGSYDCTIKLWDAASGALQQTLDVPEAIDRLSFRQNEPYLETNRGLIAFQQAQAEISSPQSESARGIFLEDNWISRNGENLIWLPPEYRATASDWRNGNLALGHYSGQITFFQLHLD